jgi:uncharacterized protein YndB with AHSA1/START domain
VGADVADFLYSVEREVAHPVAAVWEAWTTADSLEQWYHPTVLACVPGVTVSELRVGGLWKIAIDVPMNDIVAHFYGQYSAVSPQELLAHSMIYTQSREEFEASDMDAPAHRVVVDFEDRGASSWVRFTQYGELPEGQAEQAQAGMESYLDSLEAFLRNSSSPE